MDGFDTLTKEDKMILFEECVQPWLAFLEESKTIACKKIMQLVSKSWRTHKSDLTRNFMEKMVRCHG
jgi:hypothetical protein